MCYNTRMDKKFKVIFETLAGSHLYGTNTPESDVDIRGVFIPPKPYFLGFQHIEQQNVGGDDTVYFEIRKFLKLAVDCNPNIVELLFVPPDKWRIGTQEWETIYANRKLFLSKKARWTFSGYAIAQLHRIKQHRVWLLNPPKGQPKRSDFGLPEDKALITKDQIGAFNALLAMYLETITHDHPLKTQLEELVETRDFLGIVQSFANMPIEITKAILPVDENLMEAVHREKRYAQALREYNQYEEWKKNRNVARAELESRYGFDTKHGAHLYRLVTEGEELLKDCNITLPRPDTDLLKEIRAGRYSYDGLMELVGDVDVRFNKLYETSTLPHKSNVTGVDEMCQDIVSKQIME